MTQTLPQSGGAYIRTESGDVKPADQTDVKAVKSPPKTPVKGRKKAPNKES